MIIPNGYIAIKAKTAGGIDTDTGYPIESTAEFGAPIPCQFSANSRDNLGKVNGEHFTIAQYTVFIEEQEFTAEQIRLTDAAGNVIGDFSVIDVEPLPAVCQLKISV